jgi:hypothetical protein
VDVLGRSARAEGNRTFNSPATAQVKDHKDLIMAEPTGIDNVTERVDDLIARVTAIEGYPPLSVPGPFDSVDLITDDDLSAWESKMPSLAVKMGVYAGKRLLAKNYLAKQLLKRGVDPTQLADPGQLKDAAVFKELHLLFGDLSDKVDSIAAQKAKHYAELLESELELVILQTITPGQSVKPTISSISLLRA